MAKHAYLIMIHNEFEIFEKLICLLDDQRNDLYIHVDAKVKDFNFAYYKGVIKKSNIYYVKRHDVRWGHFSQIKCELQLLKEAIQRKYSYYHLVSGVDLPLKSQNEIHKFFEDHSGKEFVHFCMSEPDEMAINRLKYYHFIRYNNTANLKANRVSNAIYRRLLKLQNKFGINRVKNLDFDIRYGANWFSITDNLARYVVEKEEWIFKVFKYTLCGDELFLQTIVYNSLFRKDLYNQEFNDNYEACVRLIDWTRGGPYVYRKEDFNELINSNYLFARKFSSQVDNEIVQLIYNYVKSK